MKKTVFLCAMAGAATASLTAQAQEFGRVISSTPMIQQVAVPRQVCGTQPVVVQQGNSGAGALLGAIAGGAAGNAIGGGSGRAAATLLGVVGGAVLGNNIEGSGAQVQNQTTCATQTFYENRAVGYNVTYEYAGRQYTVQMPNDPGPTVPLQVTPVGAAAPQPEYVGSSVAPATYVQPVPIVREVVAVPVAPAVYPGYYPGYYYRPYYPLGVSLNFDFVSGGHHHHHGHR